MEAQLENEFKEISKSLMEWLRSSISSMDTKSVPNDFDDIKVELDSNPLITSFKIINYKPN